MRPRCLEALTERRLQRPVTEQGNAVLSLALKDGTRIRVDASAWGDLPPVAEAIAEFADAEVVTRSRRLFEAEPRRSRSTGPWPG